MNRKGTRLVRALLHVITQTMVEGESSADLLYVNNQRRDKAVADLLNYIKELEGRS